MDWDTALESAPKAQPNVQSGKVDWDTALSSGSKPEPILRPTDTRMTEAGPVPKQNPKYDPKVFTSQYLLNEALKVPGGLVGLAPDALDWLIKKSAGQPTDFGNITRKLQTATGADVNMRPPGPGSERLGILTQNVVGSAPFAAAAIPVRGGLGVLSELASGLGAGVGQVVGRESGNPAVELGANVAGSMAGYRAGNIVEKVVPLGKMAFEAMASKEARAATALKARGLVEGSPEYQQALAGQIAAAKGEILGDLSKAYAQEDMTAVRAVLDQYDTIKQKMPGFKASVGEITGNEPALAMQAKLESRNIPALEERGARIRSNQRAITDARGALVPSVPGAGRAALRGAQSSLDDELRALGDKESALSADLSGASTKMEGAATPVAEAGTDIKGLSQEGYLASRGTANQKYQAFRESIGQDGPAPANSVVAKVDDLEKKFVFDKQPEVIGLIKGVVDKNRASKSAQVEDKFDSLLTVIKRMGGITTKEMSDITGEATNTISPGLFRKDGRGIDELATELRVEHGFMIPDDATAVNLLKDMIGDELRGTKHYSADDFERIVEAQRNAAHNNSLIDAGPKMSVEQLDDLSAVANRDIQREMSKSNPDRRVIAQLQSIRTEAKSTIESTLTERGNTDALTKYQEANRYFGQEHAPKYLTGVNLTVRQKTAIGEQRIKPESVVAAYFKPNGTTEARRFNEQFADNGAAKETLARGVFDLYKRQVIDANGGVINSVAHDSFMRRYGATLNEYPWIAKRLEKNAVSGEIANRMSEVRAQRGEIAASDVAKAVGERDPEAFIAKAVADKRFMFETMGKLRPDDRKNMAIAVLNKAWDQSAEGSSAVNRFLENENNVNILFRIGFGSKEGAEHLNNIKLMARALEINEAAPKTSPMTALAEDTMKAKTGTSFLQVMSALRSMGRRPGSGDWFAMVFGGQFIKARIDAQKTEILKEQLFDPKLLQATLQEARTKGPSTVAGIGGQAMTRAAQIRTHLWDLTKAAVGQGAPTAAAKRLPMAVVATEDQNHQ